MTPHKDHYVWLHRIEPSRLDVWRESAFNNLTRKVGKRVFRLPTTDPKGVRKRRYDVNTEGS